MKNYSTLLLVIPERLGETVFCLPAINFLRHKFSRAKIDAFVFTNSAVNVLKHNPHIDNVIFFPAADRLNDIINNYAVIINFGDNKMVQACLGVFSGEKIEIIDCNEVQCQYSAERILNTLANKLHITLTDFTKKYDIYPQPENLNKIQLLLTKSGINTEKHLLVGFHLGCHGLTKKRSRLFGKFSHPRAWPLKYFIVLAKKLKEYNSDIRIILTGSQNESELGEIFSKKIPNVVNLIDKIEILDCAALMNNLRVFITNDTGMLHVACATNVKIIALFSGKSYPCATGPYPPAPTRIVLQKNEIKDIKVEEVFLLAINLFMASSHDSIENSQ